MSLGLEEGKPLVLSPLPQGPQELPLMVVGS